MVGAIPFNDAYGDVEGPAVDWVCINGCILAMVESPNAHPGDHRRTRTPIKKTGSKWKRFDEYVLQKFERSAGWVGGRGEVLAFRPSLFCYDATVVVVLF